MPYHLSFRPKCQRHEAEKSFMNRTQNRADIHTEFCCPLGGKCPQPWADYSMLYYSILLVRGQKGLHAQYGSTVKPLSARRATFPQGDNNKIAQARILENLPCPVFSLSFRPKRRNLSATERKTPRHFKSSGSFIPNSAFRINYALCTKHYTLYYAALGIGINCLISVSHELLTGV